MSTGKMDGKWIASEDTRCAHADVIGDEALRGKFLGSGPILKKIDLLVSEVCWLIARTTVVTVAFDTFKLLHPVFHGDFIRLEGRALAVNSSSMVCQASVYRHDVVSGTFQLTHNAVVTFVALDSTGKVNRGLPPLFDPLRPEECKKLRDLADKRKDLTVRWKQQQDAVSTIPHITHEMIPSAASSDGAHVRRWIDIQDTVVETRNTFLVKHANLNRNVFGGVLLDWMDRAALHCARNFTKNFNMVTVGMDRVHFKLPIYLNDLISIRARVCAVRKYSLEIEIAVYRIQKTKHTPEISHSGYFEVLNLEEDNRKREIHVGVTAKEDDQDGMQALMKAARRQQFQKEDAELMSIAPIPVSISKKFTDLSPSRL